MPHLVVSCIAPPAYRVAWRDSVQATRALKTLKESKDTRDKDTDAADTVRSEFLHIPRGRHLGVMVDMLDHLGVDDNMKLAAHIMEMLNGKNMVTLVSEVRVRCCRVV